MVSLSSIFQASISGSVQFIILNGAGALIAHLGYWDGKMSADLSSSVFKVFMPALVFGPVMGTAYSLRKTLMSDNYNPAMLQDLLVPFTFSVLLSSFSAILFALTVLIIGRGKHHFVRALMWCTLMLGNSTTLPVVILQALCKSLPALNPSSKCISDATAYSAIFLIPQIVLTWAVAFPCLQAAAIHDETNTPGENSPLLPTANVDTHNNAANSNAIANSQMDLTQSVSWSSMISRVFNPPVATVFVAGILGFIPGIPEVFVREDGMLKFVVSSLDSLGLLAVYLSAIIVGAEIYEALKPTINNSDSDNDNDSTSYFSCRDKSKWRFGTFAIMSVTITRIILFPLVSLFVYYLLNMRTWFYKDILGLFVLQETNLTTSASCILMVSMLKKKSSFISKLQKDIAMILFIQLCITPLFLTLNTSISIWLQFNSAITSS